MMAKVKSASEPGEIGGIEVAKGQHWIVHTIGWPGFLCLDRKTSSRRGEWEHRLGLRQLIEMQSAITRLVEPAGIKGLTRATGS